MKLDRLFERYAEFHRRKWFPARYPEPLGELVDDVTEDTLQQLQSSPGKASAALSLHLLDLLPQVHHKDLFADLIKEYQRKLEGGIPPAAAAYYLRALPEADRALIWEAWKDWARQSRTPLRDWLDARTKMERRLNDTRKRAHACFEMDLEKECASWDRGLRATRELFDFELRRFATGRTLADWLSVFRMKSFDTLADWSDFPALARNWSDVCHVSSVPSPKRSQELDYEQQLYAVDPPARVVLRYGKAAGPVDALRFVLELGRASFYSDMDPNLSVEDRLLGDPQVPYFWSFLYGGVLAKSAGIARLVRVAADDLAPRLRALLQFWNRYDCVLALFHERVAQDLKEAQDLYVACWEAAFAFEPPYFLYLFDLERSGEALWRISAFRAASAVAERLRLMFGNQWFASSRCANRLRDYRHEGFRLTLAELMQDLEVRPDQNFFMNTE